MMGKVHELALNLVKYLIRIKFPHISQITTAEFAKWLSDSTKPQPLILDARNQVEYAVSHIKAAVNIDPIAPDFTTLLLGDKNTPIVVYCSVGYRSAKIAEQLHNQGFTQIFNLSGGIFQWANEARPIYTDDKSLTKLVHPYDAIWENLLKTNHRD